MSRDLQSYLADIRTASDKVLLFMTAGIDRDSFFADDKTYHAGGLAKPANPVGNP